MLKITEDKIYCGRLQHCNWRYFTNIKEMDKNGRRMRKNARNCIENSKIAKDKIHYIKLKV